MLIAKSGLRKGYPVKQAQKLVESLEIIKVVSGRNSIQSIITELSKQWTLEGGKILKNAQAFIVNDELDSLLIGDPQAQTILTALYDSFYHKKWLNTLKKDGREILNELYITMLTATNPEHLNHFLDKTSAKGGFLGRTIMVYEDKKSKINPLIEEDDSTEVDTKPLMEELLTISKLKGQIKFTKDAVSFYKKWYKNFYEKLETGEISDESGTAERAGDTVLKLSMLLSLDRLSMIVNEIDIDIAVELFYDAARSSKRVLAGAGSSESSDKIKSVLGYLLGRKDYSAYKKQILAAKYGDLDTNDLSKVIDTLEQAGIVEVTMDKTEGYLYKITEKYAKEFKNRIGD
jgi:DNA-binding MarR family transcriptional regulator